MGGETYLKTESGLQGTEFYERTDRGLFPVDQQRVIELQAGTEKAELVRRMREAGYTEEQIREEFAPKGVDLPDASWMESGGAVDTGMGITDEMYRDEMDPYRESAARDFWAGAGDTYYRWGQGGEQFARKIGGLPTDDLDERILERRDLNRQGGLDQSRYGTKGSFAPYLPFMALNPPSIQASMALGAAEGAVEGILSPVDPDARYLPAKGEQIIGNSLIGVGVPATVGALGYGWQYAKGAPDRRLDRFMRPVDDVPPSVIQKADDLSERTGVPLTPAQRYEDNAAKILEERARGSLHTTQQTREIHDLQAGKFEEYVNRVTGDVGPQNRLEIGERVQTATREYVEDLLQKRRAQADADYAVVRDWENGRPMVDASNYRSTLEGIIEEGRAAGASQDQMKAAKAAEDRLARLEDNYGYLTGQDIEQLSRAGQGTGSVWEMADRSYESVLNDRLRRAALEDARAHPDLEKAIADARANYKAYSEAIDSVEQTALGKLVGEDISSAITDLKYNKVTPEQVFEKVWAQKPSDVTLTMNFLDKIDPELADQFRRSYISRALEASRIPPASGGVGGNIDFNRFLQSLGVTGSARTRIDNDERIRALFAGTEYADMVEDMIDVSRRIGDVKFRNMSNTEINRQAGEDMAGMAFDAGTGDLVGVMSRVRRLLYWLSEESSLRATANRMDPRRPEYLVGQERPRIEQVSPQATILPVPPALGATGDDQ